MDWILFLQIIILVIVVFVVGGAVVSWIIDEAKKPWTPAKK